MASHCVCEAHFTMDHALSSSREGFPTICHNEIREITNDLLTELLISLVFNHAPSWDYIGWWFTSQPAYPLPALSWPVLKARFHLVITIDLHCMQRTVSLTFYFIPATVCKVPCDDLSYYRDVQVNSTCGHIQFILRYIIIITSWIPALRVGSQPMYRASLL